MDMKAYIHQYWKHVAAQNEPALRAYFDDNACIRWRCTNEQFTVDEFMRANCEYPGAWQGEVERIEAIGNTLTTATRVWGEGMSFHVCSFFTFADGKITLLDEYWGDDGPAPQWRQDIHIGKPIA